MAIEVDFLTWAESAGANVLPQASYASNPAQGVGVSAGIASSALYNKAQRQSAHVTAAIANYMGEVLQANILDDANLAEFLVNFYQALLAGSYFVDIGAAGALQTANPTAPLGLTFPAPIAGLRITVKAAAACSGATTLNWMGTGVKNVQYADGSALQVGDYPVSALLDLEYDGATWRLMAPPIGALKTHAPRLIFTSTAHGSGNFTVPAGLYVLYAECVGAGGGGAGHNSASGFTGGGGAAGGFCAGYFSATPGQVIPYVVGQGGTAGPAGTTGTNGGAGGTSSLGSDFASPGGPGGASTANASGGIGSPGVISGLLAGYVSSGGDGTDGAASNGAWGGNGGASRYGGGSRGSATGGLAAGGIGSGGGGGYNSTAGSAGADGGILIWG